MVTYTLPFMILFHFVVLSLIILGNSINGFSHGKNKLVTFIGYGIVLFSMLFIFVIVFFPFPVDLDDIKFHVENHYGQKNNFIPLKSIILYLKDFFNGYYSSVIYQMMGNIILFIPFGLGTYILLFYDKKRFFKMLVLCIIVSFSIEVMQGIYSMLLGYSYRSMDIDDLLLNIVGGISGFFTAKLLYLYLFPKRRK